ncbi:hypothetical protein [Pseudomonas brassicacearum]|uniref:Uncharacterized protein n=1 Tax=Pseudomonas brassicacearum TaxID=930166 RepID=A0A423GNM7_9PSED|nr:hypothetical protein [Pseudomonas brassicacearum]ROM93886.1 hypothetical protein BK658_19705 [Pseudomonas brassicacearum]
MMKMIVKTAVGNPRLPLRVLAGGILLLALMPVGFDLYHANLLEQAAKRLDRTSVAVNAQRSADQASFAMLGARLMALQVNEAPQHGRTVERLLQLREAAVNDQLAHISRLEYVQGEWQLEVLVKSFEDIDELQRRWQTLGFRVDVDRVRKSEQGVQVQINLKG